MKVINLIVKTVLVCTVAAFTATVTTANDTSMRDMQSQLGLVQSQNKIQYDESEQTEDSEEQRRIRALAGCGVTNCENMQLTH